MYRRLHRQRPVDRRVESGQRPQQHNELAPTDARGRRYNVSHSVRIHPDHQDATQPHGLGAGAAEPVRLHGAVRVGVRVHRADDDRVDGDVGHHRPLRRRLQAVPGATPQPGARQDGLPRHRRHRGPLQHPALLRAPDPPRRRPVRRRHGQDAEDGARRQLDLLPRLQDDPVLRLPRLRTAAHAHRAQHDADARAARRAQAAREADAQQPEPREHDPRACHRRQRLLRVPDPRSDAAHHHDVRQPRRAARRGDRTALCQRRHEHAADDQLVDELPRVLPHRQEVPQDPRRHVLPLPRHGGWRRGHTVPDGDEGAGREDGTLDRAD